MKKIICVTVLLGLIAGGSVTALATGANAIILVCRERLHSFEVVRIEPAEAATFFSGSYGINPGSACTDAISAILDDAPYLYVTSASQRPLQIVYTFTPPLSG